MKAYTDIEQSRKLAEILPLETADSTYERVVIAGCNLDIPEEQQYIHKDISFTLFRGVGIPCWSLAALLELLPEYNLQRTDWVSKTEYKILVTVNEDNYASKNYNNPLDACYEMILKLHELKML